MKVKEYKERIDKDQAEAFHRGTSLGERYHAGLQTEILLDILAILEESK